MLRLTLLSAINIMTIFDSLQHSQNLLQQLAEHQKISDDAELSSLTNEIITEINSLKTKVAMLARQPTAAEKPTESNSPIVCKKSGCYKFDNEQGFFCPNCYDQSGSRVPTKRLNRLLRVCPSCRSSIKPSK
jgi:hypothetical protein